MSGEISIKNGKKGGRPCYDKYPKISLIDIQLVVLTPIQYNTLLKKYGNDLLKKALFILENWLKNNPQSEKYRGKNNYAHFRKDGWVINAAKYKINNKN